jgi:hypothetical protein
VTQGSNAISLAPSSRVTRLRDLAAFDAAEGVVLSLYVGFDPTVTRTGDETAMRVASLLDQARRAAAGERLGHNARLAFDADLERAREEIPSRLGPAGVACFADSADGLWHVDERRGPLPDLARVGRSPYLVPLVAAAPEEHALVAAVGRERGEIFDLRDGRLTQLVDLDEEQPRRQRDGQAWLRPSPGRHIDELTRAHLRKVATSLDGIVRAVKDVPVVLAGEQRHTAALEALLSGETRAAVAGAVHPRAAAGATELTELARAVLERRRQDDEDVLVDRWSEAWGRGAAVAGWPDTLAAASDGRVAMLLFREGVTQPAFACDACGRASTDPGTCPLDGQPLGRRADGLDVAVRLTLVHGGEARALRHRPDLDAAGGIGALLLY